MDNISHSLVSIAVAATITRSAPPKVRKVAIWTAIIAGSLPDIDIVMTIMADHAKLAYLLHHRGHTHTILYVLLTGLLIGWAASWILKKIEPQVDQRSKYLIFTTAVSCSLFHLFMDWWNIYGVHPFYPFDNNWYFGDAFFIVEPIIWVSLGPFCFFLAKKRLYKGLALFVPILAVTLAFYLLSLTTAITAASIFLIVLLGEWKRPSQHPSLIICTISIFLFFISSHSAKQSINTKNPSIARTTSLDTVVTSAPANPFCWKYFSISLEDNDYVVRSGVFSHLPAIISPNSCWFRLGKGNTVTFTPITSMAENFALEGEYRIAVSDIKTALANCEFKALLIFARVPFLITDAFSNKTTVGDLRFDNEKELGFTELTLNPNADCSGLRIPPWIPPRQDILHSESNALMR